MELDIHKSCCFTGHRPDKIKGAEADIRAQLIDRIQNAIKEGCDTFITGMALGVDTWAAEEVLKIKTERNDIKLICAVPFKGMENNRTLEQQNNFRSIIRRSDDVVYIWKKQNRRAFLARDEWMVNHASRVIAVFNGTHGGTEYTINYAKKNNCTIDIIRDSKPSSKCRKALQKGGFSPSGFAD